MMMFILLFLFGCFIEQCDSSGTVSVHLISYHRSSDQGCEGGLFSSNPCDLLFTVCINVVSPNICTKRSDQYKGTTDATFGSSINGGIPNPVIKRFTTLQKQATIEVKVDDQHWASSAGVHLETFQTPVPSSHNNTPVTLTVGHAQLTISIIRTCDPNFCGVGCSIPCKPTTRTTTTTDSPTLRTRLAGRRPRGTRHNDCQFETACLHGGTCIDLGGILHSKYCQCPEGYSGYLCEITCHNHVCYNGGTCHVSLSTPRCRCHTGYSGSKCDRTPCTVSPCHNGGSCKLTNYKAVCSCVVGYNGTLCQNHMDPCERKPCNNGGTCSLNGTHFTCSCPAGYSGSICQYDPCYNITCSHGGMCQVQASSFLCHCGSDFSGTYCEVFKPISITTSDAPTETILSTSSTLSTTTTDISSATGVSLDCHNITCHNGGTCQHNGTSAVCICMSGLSGNLCQQTPCSSLLCQNEGNRILTGSNCGCTCLAGYTGLHCETVVESCIETPCQNNGKCTEVDNGIQCSCPVGYAGYYCDISLTPCTQNICTNGGTCLEGGSHYICTCPRGFIGDKCEYVDHCKYNHCHNNGTCVNMKTEYHCLCQPGYYGRRCLLFNLCHDNGPCMNGGTCSPTVHNTAECTCPVGFTGLTCEKPDLGCPHNISHCDVAECREPASTPTCVKCVAGYTVLKDKCQACLSTTPILHCEEESSSGCLFRWCNRCEEGFYRLASACEVCSHLHAGCRQVICTSANDVRCIICHPGFFLDGDKCTECPAPSPECEEYKCTGVNDVVCTKCKDGLIAFSGRCIPCPSSSVIPDCVDVGRDGCFRHWCNKCAPGFFISGTVCDVCPSPDPGCQLVQCNSTSDTHCVQCFHGYQLNEGNCDHDTENGSSPTTPVQCSDHPAADCPSLQASLYICSDPSSACHYCPRYCDMCDTCTQPVPVIG